jgi:site-specific DNA-methyltransferase (adenine-specific)
MNEIIQGDCLEVMKQIPDGSVDMVMTSPPYDNLRTYNDTLKWGDHIWNPIINELYRVVKDGGVVVWVVGDATIKGSETMTSFRQAFAFRRAGFLLHDTMIWEKDTFTATGTLRVRYASIFEYMFVFSKGKPKSFNPILDRKNKTFGEIHHGTVRQADGSTKPISNQNRKTPEYGQRFNVWRQNAEKNSKAYGHPAMFPEKLASDHIKSWSNEGDVILDPFCGSGTTCVACVNTKRNYIGIEQDEKYHATAEKRVQEAKDSMGLFT